MSRDCDLSQTSKYRLHENPPGFGGFFFMMCFGGAFA
jgi:hypothetical protein